LAIEETRGVGLRAAGVVEPLLGLEFDGVALCDGLVAAQPDAGAQIGAVLQRGDVAAGAARLIVEVVIDVAVESQVGAVVAEGERRLRRGRAAVTDAAAPIASAILVAFIRTPPQWKCAFDVIYRGRRTKRGEPR
jgi:hypothetical protein